MISSTSLSIIRQGILINIGICGLVGRATTFAGSDADSIPTFGALEVWQWTFGSRTVWLVNISAGHPQFRRGNKEKNEEFKRSIIVDIIMINCISFAVLPQFHSVLTILSFHQLTHNQYQAYCPIHTGKPGARISSRQLLALILGDS